MAQLHGEKDAQNNNVNPVCQSERLQEVDLRRLNSACYLASRVQAAQIVLPNCFRSI
ncbi:hypothetical protein [Acinetobacter schindleri]|uniref:hypothetical protein n=1 Tax=Acinetobacter schindleri TaxID=108981 RepID=UPI002DB92FE7|nr:hypothetical protein [Acinetobacter schindleri]MEB5930542.1 hypothetical protein [Acinetobacter schindleri]